MKSTDGIIDIYFISNKIFDPFLVMLTIWNLINPGKILQGWRQEIILAFYQVCDTCRGLGQLQV
jgi:hypothetical protein